MPDNAPTLVGQLTEKDLLEQILLELKAMNLQLAIITEDEIIEGELE